MRKYNISSEVAILQALYAFPYLTVKQVTRLLYSPGSKRSRVSSLLKALWEKFPEDPKKIDPEKDYKEWLLRAPLYSQSYTKEYVYWMATKGRNELRRRGYPFQGWHATPEKMATFLRSPQWDHFVETVDFLIECSLIPTIAPNLQVPVVLHYYNINRIRWGSVRPDGWLHIHYISSDKDRYYCIEIDRKSEEVEDFTSKIRMYLYFIKDGEYQKLYHNGDEITPTILFFTLMGTARGKKILSLIEDQLRNSYQTEYANIFRVAYTDGIPFDVQMFFQECWYIPNPVGRKRQVVPIFGVGT